MCWRGENIPQIAQEDIKVFKVVRILDGYGTSNIFKSIYYDYYYKVGETNKQEIDIFKKEEDNLDYVIERGLHSYSPEKVQLELYKITNQKLLLSFVPQGLCLNIVTTVNNQLNDLLDGFYIDDIKPLFYLSCAIPKGATYYENDRGEIVSNELRVDSAEEIK